MSRGTEDKTHEGAPRRVPVELREHALVAGSGHRKRTWLVLVGRTWLPLLRAPGATLERRAPGPGTVWEHVIRIELPAGTELLRVDSEPAPRTRLDALAYIERGTRNAARRVSRARFRVDEDGRLLAVADPDRIKR